MDAPNQDGPPSEGPDAVHLSEDYELPLTRKAPGEITLSFPRPQTSHPDLRSRMVKLLLEGVCPSRVAKILGIPPTTVHFHLKESIEAEEIVCIEGTYPHLYKKGRRYGSVVYRYRRRRRSAQLVYPEARVHLGNGSSYRVKVLKEGDLRWLKLRDGMQPLFPRTPVGEKGEEYYAAKLPIPTTKIGRKGAKATLVFYPSPDPKVSGGRLDVSPPELFLDQGRLIAATSGAALFKPIEDYVVNLLSCYGGWRFGEVIYSGKEVHYAFSRAIVDPLFPGLMDDPMVHVLRRGGREADYPLYRDLSLPGGELETTDLRMAQDLLVILTEAYRERTGAR